MVEVLLDGEAAVKYFCKCNYDHDARVCLKTVYPIKDKWTFTRTKEGGRFVTRYDDVQEERIKTTEGTNKNNYESNVSVYLLI